VVTVSVHGNELDIGFRHDLLAAVALNALVLRGEFHDGIFTAFDYFPVTHAASPA